MPTPWTVSRSPIAATERDARKAAVINALLVRRAMILPERVGDTIKPFAVGLFNELRLLLRAGCAPTTLRRALGAYVNSRRYFFASAQPDAMRHDVDGNAIEPLLQEARLFAQERFLDMRKDALPQKTFQHR